MIEELIRKIAREEILKLGVKIEPGTELGCRGNLKTMQALLKRGRSFSLDTFHIFRKELSSEHGGFVDYPGSGNGQGYNFDVRKMDTWIRENESRIFQKREKAS